MTKEEIKDIEEQINNQIIEMKKTIQELEELTKPIAPDVSLGRLTRMEAINEKSINEARLRQTREDLYLLEQTLERIHDTDFGICVKCQQPIPQARLIRVPQSRVCVNCIGK
ncbi:MAG: TraR/DksA C4-type zinc finger protein [Spirochaetes bacterium]|nr:TraR/DksA C4-type zinc finger protein [Spirochaetota bacterium]